MENVDWSNIIVPSTKPNKTRLVVLLNVVIEPAGDVGFPKIPRIF